MKIYSRGYTKYSGFGIMISFGRSPRVSKGYLYGALPDGRASANSCKLENTDRCDTRG